VKIEALKFLASPPGEPPRRVHLDTSGPGDLAQSLDAGVPVAFVIPANALERFRQFGDHVIDRGTKHRASGLSRYLLGKEKIPLIQGSFVDGGQLKRGVRALLSNAAAKGEKNVYLIGTGDALFQSVWEQAGRARQEKVSAGRGKWGAGSSGEPDDPEGGSTVSRFLLDVLGVYEEPPDLARKFVGESTEAKLVRQFILHAAHTKSTVLILGDTGTGKEIVARSIHEYSCRPVEKFRAVNCGGIPQELLESELFGHEKGSFTGAVDRKVGLWETAGEGTLFLDEVGDLSLAHQVKILRALEDGRIRRVGSTVEIRVNARVIAATNRDLFSMVKDGKFREDLYYRLREFLIRTPSLRDHPGDIPLIAQSLWRRITGEGERPLSGEILDELKALRWTGNSRELKAVLSYLYSYVRKGNLRPEILRAVFLSLGQDVSSRPEPRGRWKVALHKVECINHLRRVEEVVHATGAAITSFTRRKRSGDGGAVEAISDLLRQRVGELEMLCLQPLLFHKESVFAEMNRFKGSMAFFQGLLQNDARDAIRYLKKDMDKGMPRLKREIGREIRLLLSGTS
jgi:DNA-binding NtrC family response regulator